MELGETRRIPLAMPYLEGREEANVTEAMRSTWISSSGAFLERFERDFSGVAGVSHTLAVSNGTVALHLVLLGLDAGPGDEVIVPSLTYIATANAVTYVGASPVFVDVQPETWCLDPEAVLAAITDRTVGIIAVDLYGHPADYDALQAIADTHGLWLVEDAAEAPFARYSDRPAGSFGVASTFSFYGNKLLTSGEGGAVATSDAELAAKLRLIRGQGMDPKRRYYFPVVGHNFRMTNVSAAILCGQLDNATTILARRRAIYTWYSAYLREINGIGFQPVSPDVEVSPWLFSITIEENFPIGRNEVAEILDKWQIETRPFFIPIHTLPPYEWHRRMPLPVTVKLAGKGLNLPTHPGMTKRDVEYISEVLWRASTSGI